MWKLNSGLTVTAHATHCDSTISQRRFSKLSLTQGARKLRGGRVFAPQLCSHRFADIAWSNGLRKRQTSAAECAALRSSTRMTHVTSLLCDGGTQAVQLAGSFHRFLRRSFIYAHHMIFGRFFGVLCRVLNSSMLDWAWTLVFSAVLAHVPARGLCLRNVGCLSFAKERNKKTRHDTACHTYCHEMSNWPGRSLVLGHQILGVGCTVTKPASCSQEE